MHFPFGTFESDDATRAFLAVARNERCQRAAQEVIEAHKALAETLSIPTIIGEIVASERDTADDAEDAEDALKAEAARLRARTHAVRAGKAAANELYRAQRARHSDLLAKVARIQAKLSTEIIPSLKNRIAGNEQARSAHLSQLLGVCLTHADIARGDLLKPSAADRESWNASLEDGQGRLARLRAFAESGPMFDVSILLDGDLFILA
jgi:hypothetical protein